MFGTDKNQVLANDNRLWQGSLVLDIQIVDGYIVSVPVDHHK